MCTHTPGSRLGTDVLLFCIPAHHSWLDYPAPYYSDLITRWTFFTGFKNSSVLVKKLTKAYLLPISHAMMNLGAKWVVSAAISSYSDSRITWIQRGLLSSQFLITLNVNVHWWCAMTLSYSSTILFFAFMDVLAFNENKTKLSLTLVGPFPWMVTGRVSYTEFLALTFPSSNFKRTSSENQQSSTVSS